MGEEVEPVPEPVLARECFERLPLISPAAAGDRHAPGSLKPCGSQLLERLQQEDVALACIEVPNRHQQQLIRTHPELPPDWDGIAGTVRYPVEYHLHNARRETQRGVEVPAGLRGDRDRRCAPPEGPAQRNTAPQRRRHGLIAVHCRDVRAASRAPGRRPVYRHGELVRMDQVQPVLPDLRDQVSQAGPVYGSPEGEHPGSETRVPELGPKPTHAFGGSHWHHVVPPPTEFLGHPEHDQLGPSGPVGLQPQTDPQRVGAPRPINQSALPPSSRQGTCRATNASLVRSRSAPPRLLYLCDTQGPLPRWRMEVQVPDGISLPQFRLIRGGPAV